MKGMYFACLILLLAVASAEGTDAMTLSETFNQEVHDWCYYTVIGVPIVYLAFTVPRCIFDDIEYGDPLYCIAENLLSGVASTLISGYLCSVIV